MGAVLSNIFVRSDTSKTDTTQECLDKLLLNAVNEIDHDAADLAITLGANCHTIINNIPILLYFVVKLTYVQNYKNLNESRDLFKLLSKNLNEDIFLPKTLYFNLKFVRRKWEGLVFKSAKISTKSNTINSIKLGNTLKCAIVQIYAKIVSDNITLYGDSFALNDVIAFIKTLPDIKTAVVENIPCAQVKII